MTQQTLYQSCCISFLAGVFIGSAFSLGICLFILSAALAALVFFRRKEYLLIALGLLMGLLRFHSSLPTPPILPETASAVTGRIIFTEKSLSRQLLTITITDSQLAGRRALVYVPRYPLYFYGQKVSLQCKFIRPEPFEGFAYDQYLALRKIQIVCYQPQISIIGTEQNIWSFIFKVKDFYYRKFLQGMPEPESSVIRATILSERREIPKDLQTDLAHVGLTHVIAISGFHIALFIIIVREILLTLNISPWVAFWLIAVVVTLYIVMVGQPASAVRSAVMAGVMLIAPLVHRPVSVWYLLWLTAAIMIFITPGALRYDIGWQLSFAAVAGLVTWGQWWQSKLNWLPNIFHLPEIVAATLSAQMFTLPLSVYYFHNLSLSSVAANVVVIPLVAPMMIIALVVPILFFWPLIYQAVMAVLYALTYVMVKTAEIGGKLPYSYLTLPAMSEWLLALWFLILIILSYYAVKNS